jgi:hypothetical protein
MKYGITKWGFKYHLFPEINMNPLPPFPRIQPARDGRTLCGDLFCIPAGWMLSEPPPDLLPCKACLARQEKFIAMGYGGF